MTVQNWDFVKGLTGVVLAFVVAGVLLVIAWPRNPAPAPQTALGGGVQEVVVDQPVIKPIIELSASKKARAVELEATLTERELYDNEFNTLLELAKEKATLNGSADALKQVQGCFDAAGNFQLEVCLINYVK